MPMYAGLAVLANMYLLIHSFSVLFAEGVQSLWEGSGIQLIKRWRFAEAACGDFGKGVVII